MFRVGKYLGLADGKVPGLIIMQLKKMDTIGHTHATQISYKIRDNFSRNYS